jgi:5-methylcytosine-specific restriction endonuclease McrA
MEKMRRQYDTTRWRRLVKWFLNNHPLCVLCSQIGKDTPATIGDHIKPWRMGKTDQERDDLFWDVNNLQALCAPCHSAAKRIQEHHGYSQACDINGNPIDNKHQWNNKGR